MNKLLLLLAIIPSLSFSQLQQDKVKHFVAGSLISASTYYITYNKTHDKKKAFLYSLSAGILSGLAKEIHDIKTTGFDPKDILATSSGSLVTLLIIRI